MVLAGWMDIYIKEKLNIYTLIHIVVEEKEISIDTI